MSLEHQINLRRSVVIIREAEKGDSWTVTREEQSERHATAAEAQGSVLKFDQLMAEAGFDMMTTIRWETSTKIGLQIVRALVKPS